MESVWNTHSKALTQNCINTDQTVYPLVRLVESLYLDNHIDNLYPNNRLSSANNSCNVYGPPGLVSQLSRPVHKEENWSGLTSVPLRPVVQMG